MALDDALKTVTLARADHVHAIALIEDGDEHLITRLRRFGTLRNLHLALHARRRHVGLLVMTHCRLGGAARRTRLDEANLHGLVAVGLRRLRLHDDAGTRLEDGRRFQRPVFLEELRHPDFLADDACNHSFTLGRRQPADGRRAVHRYLAPSYLPCSLPNALISTSTPAGRSSFINASTVCGVGSKMSTSRLCVRISNCSRDFLSTCGERRTVQRLISAGNGIGPASRAPVRFAVSTISPVLWSSTRAS